MQDDDQDDDDAVMNDALNTHLPRFAGFGGTVLIDLGDDGAWLLDGTGDNPSATVVDGDAAADCTIKAAPEILDKLLAGELNPMLAFTLGKIKVSGKMELIMKLQSILGDD